MCLYLYVVQLQLYLVWCIVLTPTCNMFNSSNFLDMWHTNTFWLNLQASNRSKYTLFDVLCCIPATYPLYYNRCVCISYLLLSPFHYPYCQTAVFTYSELFPFSFFLLHNDVFYFCRHQFTLHQLGF